MNAGWTPQDLSVLGAAHSLVLSVGDGSHPGVEVGMVVVEDDLYVRAQRGVDSRWYQAAREHARGRIRVDSLEWEVVLETDNDLPTQAIDAAYREKYGTASTLLAGPNGRAATIRIEPAARGSRREPE